MIEPASLVIPLAMTIALLIDAALGEPAAALHPVVWMGKFLNRWGRGLTDRVAAGAFFGGATGWIVGAALFTGVAWAVSGGVAWMTAGLSPWPGLAVTALVSGVLLKPLLAWRLLRTEVLAVEFALGESLEAGRARVAHICSRDTRSLTEGRVRETAIESLAENLNDSVIAPLFWFAVAGLAGATLYRFANTADAMWGYRDRWEWAGKWAARADDVLSWIPARLTAAALVTPRLWRRLRVEARRTPSPNSGWPMGAMALRLGIQLGKPGVYVLNPQGRHATAADTSRAARVATAAIALLLVALSVLALMLRLAPPLRGLW
jgi:adenosylcobinamide-phosphate synthase